MRITQLDEEICDLEWFAVDKHGAIGFFTTGGFGILPESIRASKEDTEVVRDFFWNIQPKCTSAHISERARDIFEWKNEDQQNTHMQSYLDMSCRGVFSYQAVATSTRPNAYHRVAVPQAPIRIYDLPEAIRTILARTVFESVSFGECHEVKIPR
jgi:hypothetical protein